jgi:hypothetical protein
VFGVARKPLSDPFVKGGIHLPNLPQLLHGCPSPKYLKSLDGIAIISDIVASPMPENAARSLRTVLDSYHRVRKDQAGLHAVFGFDASGTAGYANRDAKELLEAAAGLIAVVRETTPLAHQVSRRTFSPRTTADTTADHEYRGCQRFRQRDPCHGRITHYGFRGAGSGRLEQSYFGFVGQLWVRIP